jgi:hypothetical protein
MLNAAQCIAITCTKWLFKYTVLPLSFLSATCGRKTRILQQAKLQQSKNA